MAQFPGTQDDETAASPLPRTATAHKLLDAIAMLAQQAAHPQTSSMGALQCAESALKLAQALELVGDDE
jgi:hypothetical protein